eukprot:UN02446
MIKIIVSVFAFYQLALGNKRLLLQPGPPAWVPPELPAPAAHAPTTVLECTLPNIDPAGCAGRETTMVNPPTDFKMTCSARGACASAKITYKFVGSGVERVEQMEFSEMYAGYRATVTIDSTESLTKQYINMLECKAFGACLDTTIILIGGASLNDVDCPEPDFCTNCNVKECVWGAAAAADGTKPLLCDLPKACFGY